MIYKNLRYYKKKMIIEIIWIKYNIDMNLWKKEEKILNSYIFYQLYKYSLKMKSNMIIYLYDIKNTFQFWEINFIEYLTKTHIENKYIIIIIDYIIFIIIT